METLLGDPAKATAKLGWKPEISFKEQPRDFEQLVDEIDSKSRFILPVNLGQHMTKPLMMADFFSFANGAGFMMRLVYLPT